MRDHGSVGLFREWCFGEEFGSECLGLFLFCFCLMRGEKIASAQDFWLAIKGRGPLQVMVSFLFLFTCDNYVLFIYCLVQRPFCIFLLFSSDLWSGIFLSFLLSSNLWLRIFFFCFLPIFDWEFSSFAFFWGQGWTFSPWVKVYGELGFWLKACRTAGHDICQGVGLVSGSRIKGMSHIISMRHMQQWWFGNFMQNWSCMHPCGHLSIKFLWSCDTRDQDSFSLFRSTQCFQNMFFYQFMHSFESILGVRENFHSTHPLGVYTFFQQNPLFWSVSLFQRKARS